jgi:aryl-alcohol dehydrogenase-like predicted oxidoreductase
MRLAGPNVFGPPKDRRQAIAVLREAVDSGVEHIDTAQFYGPDVVNELIREALHPYPPQLVIVSKVGARRDQRGGIFAADAPGELRRGIEANLRTLDLDTLAVVNLRLMRPTEPDAFFDDQLAAMVSALDDGLAASIGLSNITLDHLLYACCFTDVACVQNEFHPADRASQSVLDECGRRGIAFVPFASLGFGSVGPNSVLEAPELVGVATRLGCTPSQVALAWALDASRNLLVIPGTSSLHHLRENLSSVAVQLDADALGRLALMWRH